MTDSHIEYVRRLATWQQQLASINGRHKRLWAYLVIAAVGCVAVTYEALSPHRLSGFWIALPLIVGVSILQSLATNSRTYRRAWRIVKLYELGIARLRHQWQGRGIDGEEFQPDRHPYARDLGLFGVGSLFELLCTARTSVGRARLANWLLHAGDANTIRDRQAAVAELRDNLVLQEDWASLGDDAISRVNSPAHKTGPVLPTSPFRRTCGFWLYYCQSA